MLYFSEIVRIVYDNSIFLLVNSFFKVFFMKPECLFLVVYDLYSICQKINIFRLEENIVSSLYFLGIINFHF